MLAGRSVMEFDLDRAVCLTGCTASQLRYWMRTGLIDPSSSPEGGGRLSFTFSDLVGLRAVRRMLDAGISLQKVRKTLEYLRENLEVERPLSECLLVTDGSTIFRICEDGSQVIDTLRRGQLVFSLALGEIVEEIRCRLWEIERDREAFLSRLLQTGGDGGALETAV